MASNVVNDPQRISYPVISTSDISANNQVIGFRNRVINGNMRIDQRNVGATISASANNYCTDRWSAYTNFTNLGFLVQSTNNSAPGFTHYLAWNNSATLTSSTTVFAGIHTTLEGNTVADLMYGSANCQTMTLSFMVYASAAGAYSFCIRNGATSVSYSNFYNVNAVGTWQKVVLIIPGSPIGTWITDTGVGMELMWGFHGSGVLAAPSSAYGTWSTNNYIGTANMVNLGAIANSYFVITGVQLELGSLATKFEWRPWETEMRMCQRYYEKSYDYGTAVGSVTNLNVVGNYAFSNGFQMPGFVWKVEKRVAPSSATIYSPITANTINAVSTIGGSTNLTTALFNTVGTKGVLYITNLSGLTVNVYYIYHYTVSADF